MKTATKRRHPTTRRPAHRQNPPPRKGALIEVEKRSEGHYFRHPLGHLAGPFRSRVAAQTEGARVFAAALHPSASRAELTELAAALLDEDPERPFVRKFSDGWRVWDPARRVFLRGPDGAPFATRGEAEGRRRELAGEASDDGPMFQRAAPAPVALDLFAPRPARGGGGAPMQQLGLFGARENPRAKLRAESVPPPRTLVHIEVVPHAGTPRGTVLARFTAIPPYHGKGRAPRWSINALVGQANGFTFSKDLVIVPVQGRDDRPTERAVARLAELHHGDPKALRTLISIAPRENPSPALGPLRGGDGEAVVYRPRGDGTVIVRASHAGAGSSEREMTLASALEHRARLLRLGYRANPTSRRTRRTKPRKASPKRRRTRR